MNYDFVPENISHKRKKTFTDHVVNKISDKKVYL